MFNSILVPLDGSPFGEHALPLALAIARRAKIPIHLIHVHVPLAPMFAEGALGVESTVDPRIREVEKAYLDTAVKRAAVAGCQVRSALVDGPPADAIREQAQFTGSDLIVMTTHGRGPMSRFWLGSVADQLVRRSPVPILLVHPTDGVPDVVSDDAALPHILIPLDGSKLAEQILEPAICLGRLMNSDYTLLRVVELNSASYVFDPALYGAPPMDTRRMDLEEQETKIYLDRVAARLRQQSLHVQTHVLTCQSPALAILEDASTGGVKLIALQTHGRRGLARILLGSVADKVIRGARVPVLVFRPKNDVTGEV
jgi:nucleotide-binding universal stress UspA family protein